MPQKCLVVEPILPHTAQTSTAHKQTTSILPYTNVVGKEVGKKLEDLVKNHQLTEAADLIGLDDWQLISFVLVNIQYSLEVA